MTSNRNPSLTSLADKADWIDYSIEDLIGLTEFLGEILFNDGSSCEHSAMEFSKIFRVITICLEKIRVDQAELSEELISTARKYNLIQKTESD